MSGEHFVGLMSGTSLDGVDAVLVDLAAARPRLLAHLHQPFDPGLRNELLGLNSPSANELERAQLAGNELARAYAAAVAPLLARAGVAAAQVRAIGCHGQTVRHRPARGYSVQIGNAALLAELTGMRVVADFRSRDVAAGGQGAPLAPVFHAALFADPAEDRAVLNLGGIANLTMLPHRGEVAGFDTGPGNCLLDLWIAKCLGKPYDADGAWAAGAQPIAQLVDRMLAEPYFAAPPPKSTGRELFNEGWLAAMLRGGEDARAVQASLAELTARSVAEALARHCGRARRVIACGGGVRNLSLLERLRARIAPVALESSEAHGVDPQLVEATAFAWLAKQALEGRPASLPSVTGARGARVLGAIYPA
ncbi:MAG: anhydro-N-acetylmuramic acid kinase [Pseudomonadota bacterium]